MVFNIDHKFEDEKGQVDLSRVWCVTMSFVDSTPQGLYQGEIGVIFCEAALAACT